MARPRTTNRDLPPRMARRVKNGRTLYYYVPTGTTDKVPLGPDLLLAKKKWAELEGRPVQAGTVADIRTRHMQSDGRLVSPRTQADRDAYWSKLDPVFGSASMDSLLPEHMLRYFDLRTAKHSAKKELKYLSVLCSWARSRGMMRAPHPLTGGTMRQMKAAGGRTRYVTDAELAAVREHAHPRMQDFLDLLYITGQRPADVRALTWAKVQEGKLAVRQGKTHAALRISIVGDLAAVLDRIRARGVVGMHVLLDPDGQPLKEFGWARSAFDRARKAAGADWQLRDLRAKAATDSDSMAQARKLLGHSTESMTAHYVKRHAGEVVTPLSRNKEPTGPK